MKNNFTLRLRLASASHGRYLVQSCLQLETPLLLVGLVLEDEGPGIQEEPHLAGLGNPGGRHDGKATSSSAQKLRIGVHEKTILLRQLST